MTKTIILTTLTFAVLISFQLANAVPEIDDEVIVGFEHGDTKAIPDWVDQSFIWYGQGQITQTELLNSMKYLLDNNIMFISEEAASEVQLLRDQNLQLQMKLEEQIEKVEVRGWDLKQKESVEGKQGDLLLQETVLIEQMNQDRMDSWKNEIMHGVGTTTEDPDGIDRVKVKFPWLPEDLEGDPDRPIIVGGALSSDSHAVFVVDKNHESAQLFLKILESKLHEEITEAESDRETLRNDRQLSSSQFENANQKAQQYINMLSSVMKTVNEMNQGIIRNLR